jgi:metallo-beta-lactamase family protein
MKIVFHGADRGVTGSCHLVECAGTRLLIDCGLYQGGREIEEENSEPFGFDPKSIDFLLLTHGHLDHCGRIPLLVKQGFRGEIVTTAASRELARLVMLDSAHIQEEEAARRTRRAARKRGKSSVAPLYTSFDALDSCDRFGRAAEYAAPIDLSQGVRATFLDAGHILGSANVLLELEQGGRRRRVLFSGDLGSPGRPILRDPSPPPAVDVVVMETTYGDRLHRPLEPSVEELYEAIADTFQRGGNVIIPTFALERAQELLYHLREGVDQGRLPESTPVFLDSPMSGSVSCSGSAAHTTGIGVDGHQPDHRRCHHHGGVGNVYGGPRAPSPATPPRAPAEQRGLRRVCRSGHPRAQSHRRRAHGLDLRRGAPRALPHPHDQWVLGPRRSGGAAGVARGRGRGHDFPGPR